MENVLISRLQSGPRRVGRGPGVVATVGFVLGGGLLVYSGFVHFHLWQSEGYRHIATIGPLFLAQSIAAVALGILAVAVRRVWAAALGIGFALSTMAGFVISVDHGLFGFKDSWSAPFAHTAFVTDLATVVTLGVAAAVCLLAPAPAPASPPAPAHRTPV